MRGVDVQPSRTHRGAVELIDRSGVAAGVLTVSGAVLSILSIMNGRRSRADIQAEFMRRAGRMLFSDELDELIEQLDQAHFLAGPGFEARWAELTRQYREGPARKLRDAEALGAPTGKLRAYLDSILSCLPNGARRTTGGNVVGLIAPHLDYDRGGPCYAAAYRGISERTDAERFVILGTNHFGRAGGVVGARKDFETPWGTAAHDESFMRRVEARCGVDLCEYEYDHVREHSVELQIVLLAHLLRDHTFTVAPYLCPDPCGPTGTKPHDGRGADLREFALALRAEIESDDTPTCIIAGADLSHVGRFFNDGHDLDAAYLGAVEASDRSALAHVTQSDPEAFRTCVAASSNASNICSVGCIYALSIAMEGRAVPTFLHYHQAVVKDMQNCVTCAAAEYVGV